MTEEKENQTQNESAHEQENPNTLEAQALTEMSNQLAQLKKENSDLQKAKSSYYDKLLNGGVIQPQENAPEQRSAETIREELRTKAKTNNNLENAKLYVELNDAVMREGGVSIFNPKGKDVIPSYEEATVAEVLPEILKQCIEIADGDPAVFLTEYNRRVKSKAI